MQVEFHLVDEVSATVVWDHTRRVLVVTPLTYRGGPLIDVGGIKVVGKKGNSTQALLTVNKSTGVLSLQGRRAKAADNLPFDSDQPPKPSKPKSKKKETPAT